MAENDPERRASDEKALPGWVAKSVIGALTVITLVVTAYFARFHGGLSEAPERWGQFGDYIGGVLNPVLAFLSFMALLIALVLQSRALETSKEELVLSRKELELTRAELAKSSAALDHQYNEMRRQSFENTFFQLLRRVSEVVNATVAHGNVGQIGFEYLCSMLVTELKQRGGSDGEVRNGYIMFYSGFGHFLGHYFRALYHVFKFVDTARLSADDKIHYANIARAQLSDPELVLLFYNGITGEGAEGFKPLIETYGLLKHVNDKKLSDKTHRENLAFYSPTAFLSAGERQVFREAQT